MDTADKAPASSSPRPPSSGGYRGGSSSGGSYAGGSQSRGPRPGGFPGKGGRPAPRRRVCRICVERQGGVDWKAFNFLRNFVTDRGKVLGGRTTGTCSSCQRKLATAIKRAQNMALLPTSPL